jgi:hypothetical protein
VVPLNPTDGEPRVATTKTGDNDATKNRKGTANDARRPFNPAPPPKPVAEIRPSFTVIPRLPMLANTNRCNWQSGQAGPPILVQTNAPASDTQHKTGTVAQLRDAIKIRHIPASSPSDLAWSSAESHGSHEYNHRSYRTSHYADFNDVHFRSSTTSLHLRPPSARTTSSGSRNSLFTRHPRDLDRFYLKTRPTETCDGKLE